MVTENMLLVHFKDCSDLNQWEAPIEGILKDAYDGKGHKIAAHSRNKTSITGLGKIPLNSDILCSDARPKDKTAGEGIKEWTVKDGKNLTKLQHRTQPSSSCPGKSEHLISSLYNSNFWDSWLTSSRVSRFSSSRIALELVRISRIVVLVAYDEWQCHKTTDLLLLFSAVSQELIIALPVLG